MNSSVSLGLDTFGDLSDDDTGHPLTHPENLRTIVEQGVRAETAGVDIFSIGEHHIDEMPVSAPDLVLAAIAGRTSRLRLGSAVTVLGTDDPVRVYQRYATLDAVSNGRAEVTLGRGSSTESFGVFGFDLRDYETLFEEKLALFAELRKEEPVHWQGTMRAPLDGVQIVPRTAHGDLPTWVGVGGSPESVLRASRHGMHLMLAIVGGHPSRFAGLVKLYHEANRQAGHSGRLVGVHSTGHVADTDQEAIDQYWPYYRDFLPEARAKRGIPVPTWESFQRSIGPEGSHYVGSPETVARKIANTLTLLGGSRFSLKYGTVGMPHAILLRAVDLYGTEVAPRVRAALAREEAS